MLLQPTCKVPDQRSGDQVGVVRTPDRGAPGLARRFSGLCRLTLEFKTSDHGKGA